jgi:hypothetical protein
LELGDERVRVEAVRVGWRATRARNRWLLWDDRFGRVQWFETGRLNLYVRKPASLGRAKQLICNAFSYTGLVADFQVLEPVLNGIRFNGGHYVFETGKALPKLTIGRFAKSNGVILKIGDRSHPTSVEVIASYPDWAEQNERLLQRLAEMLQDSLRPERELKPGRLSYIE